MVVTFYAMVLAAGFPAEASAAASQPAAAPAQSVSIQLTPGIEQVPRERERTFTARFTPEELKLLLAKRSDVLPLPFEFDDQREAFAAALDRISMQALVEKLKPFITGEFSNRFDVERDLIVVPVPPEQQLELEVPELPGGRYRGPTEEVMGFLVHEVTEREFISTAIRLVQTARQMLDTGKTVFDRSSLRYF